MYYFDILVTPWIWCHRGWGMEGLIDPEGKVWASDAWYIVFLDDPNVYPAWFCNDGVMSNTSRVTRKDKI